MPCQNCVIEVRDVIFDETRLYNPDKPFLKDQIKTAVQKLKETLTMPIKLAEITQHIRHDDFDDIRPRDVEHDELIDETTHKAMTPDQPVFMTPDPTPQRSSSPPTTLNPAEHPDHGSNIDLQLQGELSRSTEPGPSSTRARTARAPPLREIRSEIDESNILTEPRVRRPSQCQQEADLSSSRRRRDAYMTQIESPYDLPGYFNAFATAMSQPRPLHRDQLPSPPKNWKELLAHPFKDDFMKAAEVEFSEVEARGTFRCVKRPQKTQVLPLIWVFSYKFDSNGYLLKYKARVCVRGDLQRHLLKDTYAATLAAKVFRTLMAILAVFNLETIQLDAVNAFLNSELDEEVYVELPDGFKKAGYVMQLQRALYGLRRSPRLWHQEFSKTLTSLGLQKVPEEPCLFTNRHCLVFFFVDDIVILYHRDHESHVRQLKQDIMATYHMRDLGELKWFLGICIIRDRSQQKLWLCQDSYIEKIVKRFHLETHRTLSTPAATTEHLTQYDGQASAHQIYYYQQLVGSLMYPAIITRPDIARTSSKLSEFLVNPSPKHIDAAERAICYLNRTKSYAIEYSLPPDDLTSDVFICASDAAYADNEDRKSTEGYLFKLFGGPVDWRSGKQKTITTSTTEAELLAISEAGKQIKWWNRLLNTIDLDLEHDIHIQCDNRQTVDLLVKEDEPAIRSKLRHVDTHHLWLRDEVQSRRIQITWVPTTSMAADGLTKILPRQKHEEFVKLLGLVDISDRLRSIT